jgi:hypothetical protein
MLTGFLRAMETMRAVLHDTQAWADHLTGEGPTTVRRQREAAARALAAAPLAPLPRLAPADERIPRPEASTVRPTRRQRPALGTR